MIDFLSNLGVDVAELLGGGVLWIIDLLISVLPFSPFLGLNIDGLPKQAVGWLNYFVDIGAMMRLMTGWLVCISIYMIVHQLLKVIDGIDGLKKIIGTIISPVSLPGGE